MTLIDKAALGWTDYIHQYYVVSTIEIMQSTYGGQCIPPPMDSPVLSRMVVPLPITGYIYIYYKERKIQQATDEKTTPFPTFHADRK